MILDTLLNGGMFSLSSAIANVRRPLLLVAIFLGSQTPASKS
jgi:hypothetical protein